MATPALRRSPGQPTRSQFDINFLKSTGHNKLHHQQFLVN